MAKLQKIVCGVFLALLVGGSRAGAFCMYDGKHFTKSKQENGDAGLYATTTLTDEFADSSFVIRGTVLSAKDLPVPPGIKDDGADPYTIYRVRVDHSFKGNVPKELRDFTERNSGRFDLDVGKQYLLFLNPLKKDDWARKVAPGTMRVNYSCGQSQLWKNLSVKDQAMLRALAASTPKKFR